MGEHPDAAVLRAFYAAFTEPEYEAAVRRFLAPDVRWHVAGTNPLAGDFVGIEAVLAAMRRYGEQSGHSLTLDTRSVFADDSHTIAVHWATAEKDGVSYAAHEVDVFHIVAGRIAEFWSFSENQRATDMLWS